MLYKIDYSEKRNGEVRIGSKWVNFVADQTEAVKKFMDWFFKANPDSKVKLISTTEVQIIGDMSAIDLIDEETK